MLRFLDSISYPILIFIAVFMLLAPFSPMLLSSGAQPFAGHKIHKKR
jgi:hypothetical protein